MSLTLSQAVKQLLIHQCVISNCSEVWVTLEVGVNVQPKMTAILTGDLGLGHGPNSSPVEFMAWGIVLL